MGVGQLADKGSHAALLWTRSSLKLAVVVLDALEH